MKNKPATVRKETVERISVSLPTLSGRDVIKAFAKDGWQMVRQRGSHMILVKDGHMSTLSVPDHRRLPKAPCAA
jgi:predicted RNA binding protein YcfA (HicA-like mRNA interferase family)